MTAKGWYPNLSPDEKKVYNEKRRKHYHSCSEEKQKIRAEKRKIQDQKYFNSLSPEEQEKFRIKRQQRWEKFMQKFGASLTPEEKEKRYQQLLEKNMSRYNKLSPEKKAEQLLRCKEYGKKHRQEQRLAVITHYTNGQMRCMNPKCEVPGGAKNILALQADHINGGGRNHAKATGSHIYSWIIRNNYPLGIQILCASCNTIKKIEEGEDYKRIKNFGENDEIL